MPKAKPQKTKKKANGEIAEEFWAIVFLGKIHIPRDNVRLLFESRARAERHRLRLEYRDRTVVRPVIVSYTPPRD